MEIRERYKAMHLTAVLIIYSSSGIEYSAYTMPYKHFYTYKHVKSSSEKKFIHHKTPIREDKFLDIDIVLWDGIGYPTLTSFV